MAQANPERVALRYKVDGHWRDEPFRTLARTVERLTAGLHSAGVRPGDRVALLADTRPEWTYTSLAVLNTGAILVPIYPTSSVEDVTWVLHDSEPVLTICDSDRQRAKLEAAGATTIVDLPGLADLIIERSRSTVDQVDVSPALDDPAVIIYTSGTTGPPKGCVLTHQNWLTLIDINTELNYVTGDDLVYLFLPLAHVFAQMLQFSCLSSGATLTSPKSSPKYKKSAPPSSPLCPASSKSSTPPWPANRPKPATPPSAPHSVAGCARPCPAPPPSPRKYSSSSTPPASPCWKATE
jgi:long-chain acyl-CoA synthetase